MSSAWTIIGLKPRRWHTPWRGLHFEHVATTLNRPAGGPLRGDTVWKAADGATIGWEWVQVVRNVVALADQMAIVSNLCPVDADNCAVEEPHRTLLLNNLVNQLPWQQVVGARVRASLRIRPERMPAYRAATTAAVESAMHSAAGKP